MGSIDNKSLPLQHLLVAEETRFALQVPLQLAQNHME